MKYWVTVDLLVEAPSRGSAQGIIHDSIIPGLKIQRYVIQDVEETEDD